MYSLNRAQIIGNLTRDPEMRQTASGQAVANFGVATNRSYKDSSGQKQEQVEFHNVVVWGKLAEICSQFLGKGRKVFVEGRLQTREWEGKDGDKRRTTEIVADNMIILDKTGAPASGGTPMASMPAAPEDGAMIPTVNIEDDINVEDIPF